MMTLSDWFISGAAVVFALSAMLNRYELEKLKEKYQKTNGEFAACLMVMRTHAKIAAMRVEAEKLKTRQIETNYALTRGVDLRRDALWNEEFWV